MKSLIHAHWLVGLAVPLTPAPALAATYYVSTAGSDSATGTESAPFASLSKASATAQAGDTIYVRGGTYYITSQLLLSKSGTSDENRTKIWAYPGEVPVLDASKYVTSNAAVDVPVVLVTGSWMHLRGLTIANAKVGASGAHSYSLLRVKNASHNTFELLNLHHGFGPGLFIDTGNGGNLILNCDSHDNYDVNGSQGDGQNGDGFGVHYQSSGPSTIIRGCRAWANADDGYDLISQEVPVTIENSFAMLNGHGAEGNGNGFKVGSSKTGVRHIVRNNVAWKNDAAGFYANHSAGGNTWLNNTSYNNGTQYNLLASSFDSSGSVTATVTLTGSKAHLMRNNIGFPNKNSNMGGVVSTFNTWDLNITEVSADFASTLDAGCSGPRDADGGMPAACTFMHLKSGSPLIDKGTDVGLAFVGQAPDLGAYEFGATAAGGTSGTGGASGIGGTKAIGGTSSAGGTPSTGGSRASGGSAIGPTSGGANATGSVATAGDSPATGGRQGSGGSVSTGGSTATGNGAAGEATNLGGTTASTIVESQGGAISPSGTDANWAGSNDSTGCSCRTEGRGSSANTTGALALLGIVIAGLRRARRERRANGA